MPKPHSYPANSFNDIFEHFTGKNPVASFVNVVMVQPLANVPPFCLVIFSSDTKYTAQNVSRRWNFMVEELRKLNIKVISVSADSDPRYNSAMRQNSSLGRESDLFDCVLWFKSGGINGFSTRFPFYIQGPVHIATKLRNLLLDV